MRRFEVITEKPSRFWEVDVVGLEVHIREGRGTTAETRVTPLASARAVARYVDAQIAARRAEGFVEIKRIAAAPIEDKRTRDRVITWTEGALRYRRKVSQQDRFVHVDTGHEFRNAYETIDRTKHSFDTIAEASACFDRIVAESRPLEPSAQTARPAATAATATISDARLEAACRAEPDARGPWEVYADWLLGHGDVRGEIAALALGGRAADARALLEASFASLWDHGVALVFSQRHGFPNGVLARIEGMVSPVEVVARVLGSPLCTFVEHVALDVGWGVDPQWSDALRAIADAPIAPHLRGIRFACDDERADEPCDLIPVWGALQSIEELALSTSRGICTWGTRSLPALRRLERTAESIAPSEIDALGALSAPALAHLELVNTSDHDGDLELAPLLSAHAAHARPALRHPVSCAGRGRPRASSSSRRPRSCRSSTRSICTAATAPSSRAASRITRRRFATSPRWTCPRSRSPPPTSIGSAPASTT